MTDDSDTTRRQYLAALALASVLIAAGCTGAGNVIVEGTDPPEGTTVAQPPQTTIQTAAATPTYTTTPTSTTTTTAAPDADSSASQKGSSSGATGSSAGAGSTDSTGGSDSSVTGTTAPQTTVATTTTTTTSTTTTTASPDLLIEFQPEQTTGGSYRIAVLGVENQRAAPIEHLHLTVALYDDGERVAGVTLAANDIGPGEQVWFPTIVFDVQYRNVTETRIHPQGYTWAFTK